MILIHLNTTLYSPWIRVAVISVDCTRRATVPVFAQTRVCVATIYASCTIYAWIRRTAIVPFCNEKGQLYYSQQKSILHGIKNVQLCKFIAWTSVFFTIGLIIIKMTNIINDLRSWQVFPW